MKLKYEAPEVAIYTIQSMDILIASGIVDGAITDPPDAGWSELKPIT